MRVLLHDQALRDVRGILEWLDKDSSRASEGFLEEFTKSAGFIAAHPDAGHPSGKFRRWNSKRFPFHFLYLAPDDRDEIWIMVVRHDSRHPSYGVSCCLPEP
jgi:plasmid stabilization system protein ParE